MRSVTTTIVVIGAGFSGAVTAVNLLRQSAGRALRVVLINKSGRMARGTAYGTSSAEHLLNVPAGNMSALADDPDDFLHYCRWADPAVKASSFVRRQQYGAYLEALLEAASVGAPAATRLERWVGDVVDLESSPDRPGAVVHLADGRHLWADFVVLAFGHFPPADPATADAEVLCSDRYVRDPWASDALDDVTDDEPVLTIGTGLTAVDVALALAATGRRLALTCISRRGLLPAPHRPQRGHFDGHAARQLAAAMGTTVRDGLHALRQAVRDHTAAGGDWRDVLAALRPYTPEIWHRLSSDERGRFLQRVQPWWDVARHRCAPQSFERFESLRGRGEISVIAGRLLAMRKVSGGIEVDFRRRGSDLLERRVFGHVINCTGPSSDLTRLDDRLVRQALSRGWLLPDRWKIGAKVDTTGALIDAQGRRSPYLYYIGPLLRARDWEATAVPELRWHAKTLASTLLSASTHVLREQPLHA